MLTNSKSIFEPVKKEKSKGGKTVMAMPSMSKSLTVRLSDNGGYIVSGYSNSGSKEHIYKSLPQLMKCIKDSLGDSEGKSEMMDKDEEMD